MNENLVKLIKSISFCVYFSIIDSEIWECFFAVIAKSIVILWFKFIIEPRIEPSGFLTQ